MGNVLQDVRYAVRMLARSPGFSTVAILTLALGIGANTAIFSLVHTLILKPLPFRDPSRLVIAWDTYLPQYPKIGVSPAELEVWRQQPDIFEDTAWFRHIPYDLSLTGPGAEAMEVHAAIVSPRLFTLLGVVPSRGRAFRDGETPDSILIGQRLWMTRFGGDPQIIGKSVRLNDQSFTIAGVMPADFKFPEFADVWLPPGPLLGDELTNPVRHAVAFLGRLRTGATTQQAAARLETLSMRLAAEHPKTSTGWGMRVYNLQDDLTASVRPALLMLLGAVSLVLLIACGNVANLLLARASGRAKEIAVRSALGAGAWRISRQLLTESVVLSAAGGALGLLIGRAGLTAFSTFDAPFDSAVLWFALAVSIATGMVFGLAPVVQALRSDPNAVIKAGSMPAAGSAARGALVVAEFALALILVTSAGILMKSFSRLMQVDPGFSPRGVVTARIPYSASRNGVDLFHRIEERVRQLPGVDLFASTTGLPLTSGRGNKNRFNVPGSPLINPDALPSAEVRYVSPSYFRTMKIPLRSGREFTERDQNVVIVNQTLARRFWPGRDPVGVKFITGPWGPNPTWSTIVGVVGDVKQSGLDAEPTMDIYYPGLDPQFFVVHSAGDAGSLGQALRGIIHDVAPDLPVNDVQTMDQVLAESAASRRWTMTFLAAFAGLALLLALVGIYALMAWSVAQRTREIGIRVALGARSGQVLRMVVGYGMRLSAAGLAIGLAGAFAARRFLASLVFDVSTADPWIYAGVATLMLGVALLACYLPARRASRVDPLVALRWE
ncbi:MAG TPA: ABC transporter permease [Bryobacteraceae bacterium]|nr:ABC transporter permease [Bryobacteraceae bacterium]